MSELRQLLADILTWTAKSKVATGSHAWDSLLQCERAMKHSTFY